MQHFMSALSSLTLSRCCRGSKPAATEKHHAALPAMLAVHGSVCYVLKVYAPWCAETYSGRAFYVSI